MKLKSFSSLSKSHIILTLLAYVFINIRYGLAQSTSKQPNVYYATIGSNVVLSCSGGQQACFSTYIYQNKPFKMANLTTTLKYQISSGSIGVNNVKETDAGFYACSNDCSQMRIDQVSNFLQPMNSNNEPVLFDKKKFLPIPPFPEDTTNGDILYVVVTNEADLSERHSNGLGVGAIIGIVVGVVVLLLLIAAIIILVCCIQRRKKQQREKILGNEAKNEKEEGSVEYSTVESDHGGEGEKKNLSANKYDQEGSIISEINTKNIRGPNVYKPNDLNNINPKDLPNIDINGSSRSQSIQGSYLVNGQPRNGSIQGSYNGRNGSSQGSYNINPRGNQMDSHVPRPGRKGSEVPSGRTSSQNGSDSSGALPPPPNKAPVNKVQFPSRNNSTPQESSENLNLKQIVKDTGFSPSGRNSSVKIPQYVSDDNLNLQQIIKDSGFLADDILAPFNENGAQNKRENHHPDEELRQPQFLRGNSNDYDDEPKQPHHRPRIEQKQPRNKPSGEDLNGGVTVVSARSPSTGGGQTQGLSILPPTSNRSNQQLPNSKNGQQLNQKPLLPHLSYSQRIETTSTPLQVAQPSKSLRTGVTEPMSLNANINKNGSKEGSTDV